MDNLKKIGLNLFILILISLPLTINAQNENQTNENNNRDTTETINQENQNVNNQNSQQTDQNINEQISKMGQADDLEREFMTIAETQSRDLQTKLNYDDETFSEVKAVIADYLDERWEKSMKLEQTNDQEGINENATELAYLRVDLVEGITDELDDQARNQWNSNAVDFWLSLDKAVFDLKMEKTGVASDNMNDDQQY